MPATKYGPRIPPESVAVYLAFHYPKAPMAEMVASLGAPAWKIRRWAEVLQIRRRGLRPPRGIEYITHAAKRAGVFPRTLRRILDWSGVKTSTTHRAPERWVRKSDVDWAVALWAASETIESAAKARCLYPNTLRKWLRAAGKFPRKRFGKRSFRVPTDIIDAVVKANTAKTEFS